MLNNNTVKTELSYFVDAIYCLLALVVMSVFYYGYRVLIVTSLSVLVCYATDFLCSYLRNKKYVFNDYTSITGGIILALLMPASVPYGLIVIAAVIVTVIGKQAFGGNNNLIFNPIAVGYSIVVLCWSKTLLMFPSPVPMGQLSLASQITETQSHSLTYFLNMGNIPFLYDLDVLLGRFEGPMGTTHIIILFVCIFCLVLRKSASIYTIASSLATLVLGAAFFPLVANTSLKASILLELISASTIFVLIFLICDHRIMPKTRIGQSLYGILFAVLTLFLRRFIGLEPAAIFAVLFSNVLVSTMDDLGVLLIKLLKLIKASIPHLGIFLLFITISIGRLFKKLFILIKNKVKHSDDKNKEFNIGNVNAEDENIINEQIVEEPTNEVHFVENAKPHRNRKKSKSKQTIVLEIIDKTNNNKSEDSSVVDIKKITVEKNAEKSVETASNKKQNNKKKTSNKVKNNQKQNEDKTEIAADKVESIETPPVSFDDKPVENKPKKNQSNKKASKNESVDKTNIDIIIQAKVEENKDEKSESVSEQTTLIADEKPQTPPQPKKRNHKKKIPQQLKQEENLDGQISLPDPEKNKYEEKAVSDIHPENQSEQKQQAEKRTYNRKKPQNLDESKVNSSEEKADSKNSSTSKKKTSAQSKNKANTGSEKGEK